MFIAKQVQKNVPIYDLLKDGVDIGCLTIFEGEGPIATVRYEDAHTTVLNNSTIHATLLAAKEAYFDLVDAAHEHIEDEDGELARMKYEEQKAEEAYHRHYGNEPHWA